MQTRAAKIYLVLLTMLFVAGCTTPASTDSQPKDETQQEATTDESSADESSADATFAWAEIELTDVETGETFTLSELAGQQVFVQAFAVW